MSFPIAGSIPVVLDLRLGAILAGGDFAMLAAIGSLVFDVGRLAGDLLLGGGGLGRGQGVIVGGEGFREHVADLVGPAAIVLDDTIDDLHDDSAWNS